MNNLKHNEKETVLATLWFLAACPIILTILFSFILQHWDWGLMDDLAILRIGSGPLDRVWNYFQACLEFGEYKPLYAFYTGVFYSIFEQSPRLFYICKALLISMTLLLWGFGAYRLTRNKLTIFLLPAVTLSFHYFYDAFFYLSSHEAVGLFFSALAFHAFLCSVLESENDLDRKVDDFGKCRLWSKWGIGVFFLLCAFGSKEPFIATGMAFGLALILWGWMQRKSAFAKTFFMQGLILAGMTILYAFILKTFIQGSHTSSYSLTDGGRMLSNLQTWLKKDFLNHLPWVIAAAITLGLAYWQLGIKKAWLSFPRRIQWGVALAVMLYGGYLLILLPWNVISYYATPLGLFFAMIVATSLSDALMRIDFRVHIAAVICALMINQFVGQYALRRESTYQADTGQLMKWVKININDLKQRPLLVGSNAMEPAGVIPGLINKQWDLQVPPFEWTINPLECVQEKPLSYYLYSPRFHTIDLGELKGWKVGFYSQHWVMYVRPATAENLCRKSN